MLGCTPAFIYRPIRVLDSVTFGCPAPRLGLDLGSLSSALLRVAAVLARLCSIFGVQESTGLEVQFS